MKTRAVARNEGEVLAVLAVLMLQSTAPPVSPTPSPGPTATPLSTPGVLVASPSSVQMNPAQVRVVTIDGASGTISAQLANALAALTVDQVSHTVSLTASNATGSTTLHVTDATGGSVDVTVRIAFNAGTIVPQTTLKITGSPVDPDWLAKQVGELVRRLDVSQPGAQITVGTPAVAPALPPTPGSSASYLFPVQIGGLPEYFDVTGTTAVQVQNVPATPFAPVALLYDDDPERLAQDGVLFRSTVTAAAPARLYYYHDVGANDRRRLLVVLSAQSSEPAQVQLIDAPAGPNADVMTVGNAVTRSFLKMKPNGQGTVVDLQAGTPYALRDLLLSDQQGVAGSIDARVLSGGPVRVTVLALSQGVDPSGFLDAPVLPGDGHHRTGVFALSGFGSHALTYAAGGPDVKVVIGDREPTPANADAGAIGHDYGDYGVWHDVAFTLVNPSNAVAHAYLYFRPVGGVARASFTLDGVPLDLGCVRLPVPYQIASYAVAPGQTRVVRLATMTDGGSNYPAEIGATGTAPQPVAPPISAPDGCFPKPGAPLPAPESSPPAYNSERTPS